MSSLVTHSLAKKSRRFDTGRFSGRLDGSISATEISKSDVVLGDIAVGNAVVENATVELETVELETASLVSVGIECHNGSEERIGEVSESPVSESPVSYPLSAVNNYNSQSLSRTFVHYAASDILSPSQAVAIRAQSATSGTPTTTEVQWVQRIKRALAQDLFFLYYQEIRPVDENAETIREVLIRLPDESTGNILLPGEFLSVAERFHLMSEIDCWVVRRCFREIEGTDLADTLYSINLSVHALHHSGFIDFIESALKEFSVEPSHICFEITESAAIVDLQATTKILLHLKDLGFRFALDNFGRGVSALGYLRQLPVDYLKVDGSLIAEITSDKVTRTTLELVNHLGHEMGMATVASHVASSAIAEAASKLKFDYMQGCIIGEPRPFVLL